MFKLFHRDEGQPHPEPDARFTRFDAEGKERRLELNPPKFTRFAVADTPLRSRPPTPVFTDLLAEDRTYPKAQPTASPVQMTEIDDAAHLHADGPIPLSVFRNALPQRFAKSESRQDTFVFQ